MDTNNKNNTSSKNELLLVETVCTRLCHDLAGVLGAVLNGTELLEDSDEDTRVEAISLIDMSSKEAISRLKFLRQAFGLGDENALISYDELKVLVANYYKTSKLTFEWPEIAIEQVNKRTAKVILGLILISSSILIYGGKISIGIDGKKVKVSGSGEKMKNDEVLFGFLKGNEKLKEYDTRMVAAVYLKNLLKETGQKLAFENTTDTFSITVE